MIDEKKWKGIWWCVVAYVAAVAAAVGAGYAVRSAHPLAVIALADLVGTAVVFAFSRAFDNSSFYDPYWSVAPIAIAIYLVLVADSAVVPTARTALVLAMVCVWGLRLTFNWLRRWTGLGDEDWRYVDIRNGTGRAYWLVSFLGIHLVPTVVVYLGCLPLAAALATGGSTFNLLDVAALLVTAGAIVIEATADRQLHRFKVAAKQPRTTLASGLWAHCRHPNYLGEIGFWWGIFLFGLAADVGVWWTVIGPVAMTALFVFISVPLIDKRMLARRDDYGERMTHVPALLPRFRR